MQLTGMGALRQDIKKQFQKEEDKFVELDVDKNGAAPACCNSRTCRTHFKGSQYLFNVVGPPPSNSPEEGSGRELG